MSESNKYQLTKRGQIALYGAGALGAAGIVLGANTVGVPEIFKSDDEHAAEVNYFSQPNLGEEIVDLKHNPNENAMLREGRIALYKARGGDNYDTIAHGLGVKNVNTAVDEMEAQHGEVLQPGDTLALPMDSLSNPDAVQIDPTFELPHDNPWFSTDPELENRSVAFVIAK